MQDVDWAYLAGIIDADGSIGIYLVKGMHYNHQLNICGDCHLMEWLDTKAPKVHIVLTRGKFGGTWVWNTNKASTITTVLSNSIKYMTTKYREAELMLEYLNQKNPDREYYCQALKSLKKLRQKACGGD